MGCLRKLEGWSLSSILSEVRLISLLSYVMTDVSGVVREYSGFKVERK